MCVAAATHIKILGDSFEYNLVKLFTPAREGNKLKTMSSPYEALNLYFGDIHSHCEIGYGHGTLAEALANARQQLDFVAITPHAWWPDMPQEERLADLIAYHRRGFERTRQSWEAYLAAIDAANQPGQFVTLPGFEWHSNRYGDHNVYFHGSERPIIPALDLPALRQAAANLRRRGTDCLILPHHIGYLQGYRGINWEAFDSEFSPVVEIYSMHGLSEGGAGPYPYRHTMGPLDGRSSLRWGLQQGQVCGVIGSTDHHSAHPGSHGSGRLAVWAPELSREGIWQALKQRHTYALTGDRIGLQFSLNGWPMGSLVPGQPRAADRAAGGGFQLAG